VLLSSICSCLAASCLAIRSSSVCIGIIIEVETDDDDDGGGGDGDDDNNSDDNDSDEEEDGDVNDGGVIVLDGNFDSSLMSLKMVISI
jgi:hypothetical protein